MKRTLQLALSAVLVSALAGSAMAQSNFPDVPENHWAYEALARMKKEGLLIGYPDGLYRGPRAATRYELAVAMHAVWMNLKTVTDGLDAQIKALEGKDGTSGDIANLKAAVDQLKADVAGMKGWGDDIAALKRASSTFEAEFKSMGVDIEKMKKDLADLGDRVTVLEKAKLPFTVSGDLSFVALGGYSTSGTFGITTDGRYTGVGRGDQAGNKVGATRDLSIGHEFALTLHSNADKGPEWGLTTVIGNTTGNMFGNQSTTSQVTGVPGLMGAPTGFSEGKSTLYIHDAWIKFNSSLASLAFTATIGRQGMKVSPYIYQRPDTTPFFENSRWDNGEYSFDGAKVAFSAGPAKLSIFGGRTASASTATNGGTDEVGGGTLQPIQAGKIVAGNSPIGLTPQVVKVDQQLGVTANIPLSDRGSVNLAYIWLDSNNYLNAQNQKVANRVEVYGGDVNFDVAGFGLNGGYSKSDVKLNNHSVVKSDNDAYWVSIKKDWDRWGAKVGYQYVAPLFGAPGDWGRIGTIWNPTDVKGFNAGLHFGVSDALMLWAKGQWLEGTGRYARVNNGLQTDDKIESYEVGLDYKFAQNYTASVSYEDVTTKSPLLVNGNPKERWYNIGLGWSLSDTAKLKFLWQISDHDFKGNNIPGSNLTTAKGGLISTQLSVKF